MPDRVLPLTARRVLERMGFSQPPPATWAGLDALYLAWCRSIPFEDVRKRIALNEDDPAPLPGGHAEDFFEAWLEHGTGGTCWPAANALFSLLKACGFDARRIAGAMLDADELNHAAVVVAVDGTEYLLDSYALNEAPLPLSRDEKLRVDDPIHPMSLDPIDVGWRMQCPNSLNRDRIPCRLHRETVGHAYFLERYELSRMRSPFNTHLFARRNREDGVVSYAGRQRFVKTAAHVDASELAETELVRSLERDLGLGTEIVRRLEACGGAD